MQTQTQTQAQDLQLDAQHAATMQILILDDNDVDRMQIIRLCEDAGLSFVSVEVGTIEEFRVALSSKQYDLVFIDYLLVGEDGLQAVDILNEHSDQRAASIMVAGEGQIGIAVEAMRRGCSDYLTKSELTVAALQKSVATAIERRMMSLTLAEERAVRLSLERSIRQYASSCSAEMRAILSATLRRVRTLRTQKLNEEGRTELGELETTIDQLWDALPSFSDAAERAIKTSEKARTTGALASVTQLRPN